jgi:hypothetical protein
MNHPSSNYRIDAVFGLQEEAILVTHQVQCDSSTYGFSAIGFDWTSGNPALPVIYASQSPSYSGYLSSRYALAPPIGFHFWQAIESSGGGAGAVFYGTTAGTFASGMTFNARM